MNDEGGEIPEDPRMNEAALDVARIAAWLEHRHPKRGVVLGFGYDWRGPEGGTIAAVDVYQAGQGFAIDRELACLATRAAWALGWPRPTDSRGLPVVALDPGGLSEVEKGEGIRRIEAALAAAGPEILEHPVLTQDDPLDSEMDDFDAVAAWLDQRHPGRISAVVVQHDLFGDIRRQHESRGDAASARPEGQAGPGEFGGVRVDTPDGAVAPSLDEEAARALQALGWRQDPRLNAEGWSMSWEPGKMSAGFKAGAAARVREALDSQAGT